MEQCLHHFDALLLGDGRLGGSRRQAGLLHLQRGHRGGRAGLLCIKTRASRLTSLRW